MDAWFGALLAGAWPVAMSAAGDGAAEVMLDTADRVAPVSAPAASSARKRSALRPPPPP